MKIIKYAVPRTIYHIRDEETKDLKGIKEISFHKNIVKLDNAIFKNQEELKKVYFEKNSKLSILSESLFENCIRLTNINLPENLISIGKNAFKNCKNLKELRLPVSIKDVHPDAFYGWNEDQIIYTPYKIKKPITCKATIIIDNPYHSTETDTKVIKKKGEINFYLVTTKCGHVGRNYFMPITYPVKAFDKKEAVEIVRKYPRVKRDHKDFVISVELTDLKGYEDQIIKNNHDPYLYIKRKKDQNLIFEEIKNRLKEETNYVRLSDRHINKYKKCNSKFKKSLIY